MFMPVILELCKLRWQDFCMFKATLGYRLRPCLRKTHKTTMSLKKPPDWLGSGGVQLHSQLLAGRGRRTSEFETSLIYRASSRVRNSV